MSRTFHAAARWMAAVACAVAVSVVSAQSPAVNKQEAGEAKQQQIQQQNQPFVATNNDKRDADDHDESNQSCRGGKAHTPPLATAIVLRHDSGNADQHRYVAERSKFIDLME